MKNQKSSRAGVTHEARRMASSGVAPQSGEVRKDHWVENADRSKCCHCQRNLSAVTRRHHCRKCGEIFCGPCSAYTRRLNADAEIDPNGAPHRVCVACHAIQAGTERGDVRDLMEEFRQERKKGAEETKQQDELLRKLAFLRSKMIDGRVPPDQVSEMSKQKKYRIAPEWQAQNLNTCSNCRTSFGITGRKHHCRLLGKVFCNSCSVETPLDIVRVTDDDESERFVFGTAHGSVWISRSRDEDLERRSCHDTLLEGRKRWEILGKTSRAGADFDVIETANDTVYAPLMELKKGINESLEQFQQLVYAYDDERAPSGGTKSDNNMAAKLHHDLRVLLADFKKKKLPCLICRGRRRGRQTLH